MSVALTTLTPPRGRAGAVITIHGVGFSNTPGQNQVEFGVTPSVVAGIVLSESPTVLQVLVPSGLTPDFQTRVTVTNLDDLTFARLHWFVLPPAEELAATALPAQQPGPLEDIAVEVPARAEAKDFERLTAFIQAWVQEVLPNSDPVQAVGVGASRIGVDVDALQGLPLSAPTVQAALEAIAAELANDPILDAQAGTVGNVGSGEDTLYSLTVPGGLLANDGDSLRITLWGTIGLASMASKRAILRLTLGGSSLEVEGVTSGALAGFDTGGQEDWQLEVVITRTGASAQAATAVRAINGEPPLVKNTEHTVNLAADASLVLTGENATDTTDDVVVWKGALVEVVRRRVIATTRTASDTAVVSERTVVAVS